MFVDFIRRWRWHMALTGAILITLCILAVSEAGHKDTIRALNRLNAVEQDSRSISQFMALVIDAENGQRGFLLDQRKVFLQRYQEGVEGAHAVLALLLERIKNAGDAEGLVRINRIAAVWREKFDEMDMVVRKIQSGNLDAALADFKTNAGKRRTGELRREVNGLLDHKQTLSESLNHQAADVSRYSRLMVAAVTVINILLLFFVLRWLDKAWREKEFEAESLKAQQEWLDTQVRVRTSQLEQLSIHLQNILEAEKARLATELHDELGSILTAAKMDVVWVHRKLDESAAAMRQKLERTVTNIDRGIMVKRRLIENLRPTTLASFGLLVASRELAEETASRNEWKLALKLPENEPAIDLDTATALYRVLQETLTNATKYARATKISISLACSDRELTLEILDNGVGFQVSDIHPKALGLVGMQQRVRARGGSFEVRSTPGAGCRIRVVLPLKRSGEAISK